MMKNLMMYLTVVLIWGSTWLAIKFQLGVVDPMISIIYRFAGASLILFIFCLLTGRSLRFSPAGHRWLFIQGVLTFAMNYWLFYVAQQVMTSGLAAVLFSTLVFMNLINSAVFMKIPVHRFVFIGALLGLAGMTLLFKQEFTRLEWTRESLLMVGFGLTATYIFSAGNIVSAKIQQRGLPVVQSTAFSMLYGVLFLCLIAVFSRKAFIFEWTLQYSGALAFAVLFGSVIAFLCYLTLIGRLGAGKTAYIMLLTPIIAMFWSTVFEDYHWTLTAILGMVLILSGNVIALRSRIAG